jgi:uncharacterized membrane protein YkvA (DUF1232 family)
MKNRFFRIALSQASRLLGKPGRLVSLVAQMLHRIYRSDRKELSVKIVRDRFQTLGRMVLAYARGRYRAVPVKTMVSIVAAVLYFLNPIDLIPDGLFGLGLADDLAVLTWVYKSGEAELNAFLQWEAAAQPSA